METPTLLTFPGLAHRVFSVQDYNRKLGEQHHAGQADRPCLIDDYAVAGSISRVSFGRPMRVPLPAGIRA